MYLRLLITEVPLELRVPNISIDLHGYPICKCRLHVGPSSYSKYDIPLSIQVFLGYRSQTLSPHTICQDMATMPSLTSDVIKSRDYRLAILLYYTPCISSSFLESRLIRSILPTILTAESCKWSKMSCESVS